MAFDDEFGLQQVDYKVHYAQYAAPFANNPNPANVIFFENQAKEMHVLAVSHALDKLTTDALLIATGLKLEPQADHFLRYGVMRRLRMIQSAFRAFRGVITPDRTAPLSQQQSDDIARDLNAIYINIIGILDNYAWLLVHHMATEATRSAKKMAIGLFKPTLRNDANVSAGLAQLDSFRQWEADVKERRNPAAHRMPLYVPPTALTPDQVTEFERFESLISTALREQQFDKLTGLRDAQRRLGTLIPYFLHDPGEGKMPIFPTLPQDIGQMILIGRVVQTLIRDAAGS